MKKVSVSGQLILVALMSGAAFSLCSAATITVDDTTFTAGTCNFENALASANTDTAVGGCSAGNGDDVIFIDVPNNVSSLIRNSSDESGDALPFVITANVTITSNRDHPVQFSNYQSGSFKDRSRIFEILGSEASRLRVHIENAVITGNGIRAGISFNGKGGGIYAQYADVTGNHVLFQTNQGTEGGAIYLYESTLELTNSVLQQSHATFVGGGIEAVNSTVSLDNCFAYSNDAENFGGGIDARGSALTVRNTTFYANAAGGGGAIAVDGGTVLLENDTFSFSRATTVSGGGALLLFNGASGSTVNGTFYGNAAEAGAGGGILLNDGSLRLGNNLLLGNTANTTGNEVAVSAGAVTGSTGNFFGDSSETTADALENFTPGASDHLGTADGATPKSVNEVIDPLPRDNGGRFEFDPEINANGNPLTHALVENSPAIDTAATADCPRYDQRGELRNPDACDVGAFESPFGIPPDPAIFDDDDDGLLNGEEAALGTNPNDPDTDHDGVSDFDEVMAGTDPLHGPEVILPAVNSLLLESD